MIAIHLLPALPLASPDPRACRIAGLTVATDLPLPALAPFEESGGPGNAGAKLARIGQGGEGPVLFQGRAFLAGRERPVEHRLGPDGHHLTTEGAACSVSLDGATVVCRSGSLPVLADLLLGPALVLALALRGVFCLHASAVEVGGRAVAFLGESGAGKSTLARLVGWRRAADDILPVAGPPAAARPRFPQLKLAPHEQPGPGLPEELPLAAAYWLGDPEAAVSLRALPPREAALALLRHTAGARLFGRDLLERHLAFCSGTAADLPVRLLAYPRDPGVGSKVRAALAEDLGLPEEPR